jgi:hypothetical protein
MENQATLSTPIMLRLLISIAAIIIIGMFSLTIFQIAEVAHGILDSFRHVLSETAYQLLYIR